MKSSIENVDLCIYGGNAGGIAAACTAASRGLSVLVIENTAHPGGMTTAGLGETDYSEAHLVPGIAGEFYRRIGEHYLKAGEKPESFWHGLGWTHEPHVAEAILKQMLQENKVDIRYCHRLNRVEKEGAKLIRAIFDYARPEADGAPSPEAENKEALIVNAKIFIDASYEGDLLAKAGCSYTTIRESRNTYGEEFAGIQTAKMMGADAYVIPGKPESGLLPHIQNVPAGNLGDADDAQQAYNFRLCLTRKNGLPFAKPEGYDAKEYELYGRMFAYWEAQGNPMRPQDFYIQFEPVFVHPRILKFSLLPNDKADVNNCNGGTTDFVGYSKNYAEANWAERSAIWKAHLRHVQGLLYFLTTDERLSAETRAELKKWGLAKDEFTDTGHWPHQLYIREARRLKGETIMTADDCLFNRSKHPIAQASYSLDSHECRRITVNGKMAVEGGIWQLLPNNAYGVDYGAIVPKKNECSNLYVTACISASHVAYSSMRMEPVMMLLGESAAIAAELAIGKNLPVQDIPYTELSRRLTKIRGTHIKLIRILPFQQEAFEQQTADLKTMYDSGLVSHIAFVFSMEPEDAKEPLKKARILKQRFVDFKQKLQEIMPELKIGILNQSLMNHGGRRNSLEGFPEIITLDSRNNHRFCPISTAFQKYVEEMADIICSGKPDFMLIDDDFRMLLAGKGCFCPAHLERFSKKMNRNYTLEELQDILAKTDEQSTAIGRAYEEMLMDGIYETARLFRMALDRHCPEIRCGFCTSTEGEFAYAAKIAKILAGKHEPFVRLNNGAYLEYSPKDYALRVMCTEIQAHYIRKGGVKDMLSESDTFPHNRYSLSATGLHEHLCMSILAGCNGAKLWINNFNYFRQEIPDFYSKHLMQYWGMYQELARLAPKITRVGACVPLPERAPCFFNPAIQSKQIAAADFWANALAPIGISGYYGSASADAVQCLSGEELDFFTDEECRKLLSGKLLLDSTAAKKLIERGFADDIGFRKYGNLAEVGFEEPTVPAMMTPAVGKSMYFLNIGAIAIQETAPGLRILSRLANTTYKGAPKSEAHTVAPGSIYFENARGGKVVTLAFPLTRDIWCNGVNYQSPERKWYFIRILQLLGACPAFSFVTNECPIVVQSATFKEDARLTHFLTILTNTSLDPWEPISLYAGKIKLKQLRLLNPDGTWKILDFKQNDEYLHIEIPAGTLSTAILSGIYVL